MVAGLFSMMTVSYASIQCRQLEGSWSGFYRIKQAELCNQYLSKGRKVYVEGRFTHREWTGMDGQPRCSHEISASEVRFLSPRDDATSFNPTNQEEFVPEAPPQDEPDVPW